MAFTDIWSMFNSSLDIGQLLSATTINFTGSMSTTLLIIFLLIVIIAALFKMPEVLMLILLLPIIIIFGMVDSGFSLVLAIGVLILGFFVAKTIIFYR